ncbi:hypothetical protein APR50_10495 [Variovorax paradoxus]|jgi:hypothetical protein|uniref:hypothetical protein n=1 Tax=Variovorax paradoxus TaxID=34073 RepID=UPI0006E504C0|nr:hypothetical protein APR52_20745 [Variovorax paradoxus]KPV08892.1 hypothetical protein APR50_10495 [Variovorax paradoxus]KPV11389.1 hypothetical protein APR49_09370 [Variovorax paradoxus]KPV23281.1 hypothetical protein APR51_07945 [Variovorax paradoxus]KPV31153.1 hypothetical protein APR48_17660 [Variovorax paradoxus]
MSRQPKPTSATPEGAGTQYETEASGTANENGKASATPAGGDPANSPVIGNPGESRPDMAYDYGLAAAPPAPSNPRAVSQPLQSSLIAKGIQPGSSEDDTEYAEVVRARAKGEYGGIKEKGEVFPNDRNLPTYPEDPTSWFEDAEHDPDWEAKEKASKRRR